MTVTRRITNLYLLLDIGNHFQELVSSTLNRPRRSTGASGPKSLKLSVMRHASPATFCGNGRGGGRWVSKDKADRIGTKHGTHSTREYVPQEILA